MDDLRVKPITSTPLGKPNVSQPTAQDPISDFKKILSRSVEEVNGLLNAANQSTQEMVAGRLDIHQAMIAIEQAHLSFRLMLQVRNKMIAAYEEIMRMQI